MNRRGLFRILSSSVLAPVLGKIKPPNAPTPNDVMMDGGLNLGSSPGAVAGDSVEVQAIPRYVRVVVTHASISPSMEISVVGSNDGDHWITLEFDPPS